MGKGKGPQGVGRRAPGGGHRKIRSLQKRQEVVPPPWLMVREGMQLREPVVGPTSGGSCCRAGGCALQVLGDTVTGGGGRVAVPGLGCSQRRRGVLWG